MRETFTENVLTFVTDLVDFSQNLFFIFSELAGLEVVCWGVVSVDRGEEGCEVGDWEEDWLGDLGEVDWI